MGNKNYVFTSQIITKLPQLVPYCNRIEKTELLDEASSLENLIRYTLENLNSISLPMGRIIEYTRQICILKAISTKRSFILVFNEGFLAPAFTLNRAIFELWAAASFAKVTLEDFCSTRDYDKFNNTVHKLFTGSLYSTARPLGKYITKGPIRVPELIKHLEKSHPGTQKTYAFMCEYSHPNFVLNRNANFSTFNLELWNNQMFLENISIVLEKQLASLEKSLSGIKDNVGVITQIYCREHGI